MLNANITGKTADTSAFEKQNLIEKLTEMVLNDKGLYGLNWPGKYAAHSFAYTPTTKTLRPDRAESINWDSTENLFITGDNLEILKLLRTNYANQIDMIYIDPPYNTGGNDFVYKDDFSDSSEEYQEKTEQLGLVSNPKTAGKRHSNWLSMMFSRLLVAKELLKDTGVIFISIDDNEQANLKLLCDEIFGEGNFVNDLIWEKKVRASNKNRNGFSKVVEHILLYKNKNENLEINDDEQDEEYVDKIYKNPDNDERGVWRTKPLWSESNNNKRKSLVLPDGRQIEQKWFISQDKLDLLYREDRIYESKNGTINEKQFLDDGKNPKNLLFAESIGTTETATKQLKILFETKFNLFENSKPIELIKYLIDKVSSDDSLILDFFAGSGTTAHAVEKLNAEDKGSRKWILCQIDETCEKENFKSIDQISRERIRRAGASFRALKLDSSNYAEQFYTPTDWAKHEQLELLKDFIKTDRSVEDICFGIMLEKGIPLTAKISSTDYGIYAESNSKLLFVVNKKLDTNTARELAGNIKKQANSKEAIVYIYPSAFIDDAAKINCMQFFENIENLTLMEF